MMRTTSELISAIVAVQSGVNLNPFISAANKLIDQHCLDSGYTADILLEIETWLAAHFYCLFDERVAGQSVKGVGENYQYRIDLGLNQTKYGQTAMLLDSDGNLARLNKNIVDGKGVQTVTLNWLGTE